MRYVDAYMDFKENILSCKKGPENYAPDRFLKEKWSSMLLL